MILDLLVLAALGLVYLAATAGLDALQDEED